MIISSLIAFAVTQANPQAVTARLEFDPKGLDWAGNKARNLMYRPHRAAESKATVPSGFTPFEIKLGNGLKNTFVLAVNGENLLADLDGNGKLVPVVVSVSKGRAPGEPASYQATAVFQASYKTSSKTWRAPYGLNFYWREGSKGLNYFRAGLAKGNITLEGRKLELELYEDGATGVFGDRYDTVADPLAANPQVLRVQGGSFDPRGSFVIDGVNYLANVAPDGRSITIAPSFRVVAAPARPRISTPTLLPAGAKAPNFTVENFGGGTSKLSDHLGKVVILKFWATWCGPCKASMPHFQEVFEKVAPQGVDLLAVCVSDERPLFLDWVKANQATYRFPFFFDPAGTDRTKSISGQLYGVSGIPTVYIIDPKGAVAESIVGYGGPDDHRVEQALRKLGVKI